MSKVGLISHGFGQFEPKGLVRLALSKSYYGGLPSDLAPGRRLFFIPDKCAACRSAPDACVGNVRARQYREIGPPLAE